MRICKFLNSLFFCLIFLTGTYAQKNKSTVISKDINVKVTLGPIYSNDNRASIRKTFLKDDRGNIFALGNGGRGFLTKGSDYIERYNSDLKQMAKKELEVGETNGKDLEFDRFLTFAGKPYVFGDYYNQTQNKRFLFVMKVQDDCSLSKPEKIAEFSSDKKHGYFSIVISKDSSKLLIVSNQANTKKGDSKFIVNFSVFDKSLKETWSGKTTIPTEKTWDLFSGTNYTTVFKNFSVDNAGRVYALIQVPRPDESKGKNDSETFYKLFVFENGVAESKKFTIDINKKTISEFKLLQTQNPNEMIGVGTYSINANLGWFTDNTGTYGTFNFKINTQTGTISNKSINPFTKSMFEFMRINEKDQKKGEGISNVQLMHAYVTSNNNILLSLERNYVVVSQYSNAQGMSTHSRTTYFSSVIFNVKYDSAGKIMYQNFIPKSLESSDWSYGLEHILAANGENHALIFNDHSKNTEKKLETYRDMSTAYPGSGKCVVRLVTLNDQGVRKVSTLFSNKEEDFALQPEYALNYTPNTIISVGVDGKKFRLVKIEY